MPPNKALVIRAARWIIELIRFGPNIARLEKKRATQRLIRELRNTMRYPHVRAHAAAALGRLGMIEAVPFLIGALTDEDAGLRGEAAAALGSIRAREAVEPLIGRLSDADKGVRQKAEQALGLIRDTTAVRPLINALDVTDVQERLTVVTALSQMGGPDAVAALVDQLPKEEHSSIRDAIIKGLSQSDELQAADALIAHLTREPLPALRATAVESLVQIDSVYALQPLIEHLPHETAPVALQLIIAILERSGEPYIVEPLVNLLVRECGFSHAKQIADALERVGWQPDATAAGASYWLARGECKPCVAIGASAAGPLGQTLRRDTQLVSDAVAALLQVGGERSIEMICQGLTGQNAAVVVGALKNNFTTQPECVESASNGPPLVIPLINLLTHETGEVRRNAAECLKALFWAGSLSRSEQLNIFKQRPVMAVPHTDIAHCDESGAIGGCLFNDFWHDDQPHVDQGIGVPICYVDPSDPLLQR